MDIQNRGICALELLNLKIPEDLTTSGILRLKLFKLLKFRLFECTIKLCLNKDTDRFNPSVVSGSLWPHRF